MILLYTSIIFIFFSIMFIIGYWIPFPLLYSRTLLFIHSMYNKRKWKWSRLLVSDSLWPPGLYPAKLLCPWDTPGKNTGVGCHFLFPGDLSNPGIEPRSPTLQAGSLTSEPPGFPCIYWFQTPNPSLPTLAIMSLFSMSVSLFLFHR